MRSEWADRVEIWQRTLSDDFYLDLGEIDLQGCPTMEHLTPAQASQLPFAPYPAGTPWGRDWQYLWLRGRVELPAAADGRMIVLDLHPGGESTLFVDGAAFGTYRAADVPVAHHFLVDNVLTDCGRPGQQFDLLVEAYAGHWFPAGRGNRLTQGPVLPESEPRPMVGSRTVLGRFSFGVWNEDAYALWLDVQTLRGVMAGLSDGSLRRARIIAGLQDFTLLVDFEQPLEGRIAAYKAARQRLAPLLAARNGTTAPTFYAVGNAHIDMAWLWPLAETARKTARTFAAQLRLMKRYPGYRFLQSQAQLYALCQQHYPGLFDEIKQAAKAGNWIVEGSMWVEPDTNMTSGESLIRQIMHGKRYFRQEFGVDCQLLWLPDTFGYSAALPQILNGCGVKYLVTQKIFWSYNDGDPFPYHYFAWQGIDGSKTVSFLPTSYTYDTDPATLDQVWESRVCRDDMDKFLLPFGYGDGGGGPCRDHIEYALREADLEGCPKVRLAGPVELFEDLGAAGAPSHTYVGELYFNAHRGTYTSQAAVKNGNRRAEFALREAELWGALAGWGGYAYPQIEMDDAWKLALLNQFHDILPGSSIARVYEEAEAQQGQVIATGQRVAASAAASLLTPSDDAVTVCNSLAWPRTAVVALPPSFSAGAVDDAGQLVPVAVAGPNTLACLTLPACGHMTLRPSAGEAAIDASAAVSATITDAGICLENGRISAIVNSDGEIASFTLLASGRQLVRAGSALNHLALFKDVPRAFDAWDIDSLYELQPVPIEAPAEVRLLYSSGLKAAVRVTRRVGDSTLNQDIVLTSGGDRLEFDTTVDWHELHRLLKVAFPVDVMADEAINEIQFGYIRRPTHRSRPFEQDRFEVCNHRYTALADENHGAAVLNDCKYGVSMTGSSIDLTLLRAPASPAMRADNRVHRFKYAFVAWDGGFLDSPVVREGYELNVPPVVLAGQAGGHKSYFQVDDAGVVLETVKPAEDGSGDIILRLYESKNADCRARVRWNLSPSAVESTNLLEERLETLDGSAGGVDLHFRPFEVKTLRLVR